jgi:hypothetical protein
MSIRVMTWAWSKALSPTSKLVLMALADIADDLGVCWPSHPTLAAKCSLSDRTLRRILSLLQAQKLIFIEPRFNTNGSRTSNRYRLAVDTPLDNLSGDMVMRGQGGGHGCPGALVNRVLVTTTEPSLEPSLPPPPAAHGTIGPRAPGGGGGDLIYPKDLTPAQKQALQESLAVLTQDQAQQILDELSGRMAIEQVKNPVRYCAALIEHMGRGEFSLELGLKVGDARRAEVGRRAELSRLERMSVVEPGSQPREVPIEFQETMARIFPRSSTLSKKGH